MKPKVTIIIPIYRCEKYIERCIRSLMNQTLKEGIEFLFINDKSPDRSMNILFQVLKDYPLREQQITIIENERNLGAARTRMKGISFAKGDYIGWCDSDDWIDIDMYEKMILATDNGKIDIVVSDYCLENNKTIIIKHIHSSTPQQALSKSWKKYHLPLGLPFQLIRKELLDYAAKQIIPVHQGEDTYMIRYIFYNAKSLKFVNKPYYHYDRTNSASITHNTNYSNEQWLLHRQNIDKLSCLLLQDNPDHDISYRKSINALKYYRKSQYRSVFPSIYSYYYTYAECYKDICDIIETRTKLRTYLIYNYYPLFWYFFRKEWE